MDHPLQHHMDNVPRVAANVVEISRPLKWLARGARDMAASPGTSLMYGVFFAAVGYIILNYVSAQPYLFTAAVSGFMLVGSLAAAGLYEVSRRAENGMHTSLGESLNGLARNGDSLFYFGLILAIAMISWERLSAILFALFYHDDVPNMANFYREVFFSGRYTTFVSAYLIIGGALATLVYVLSAVSVPLLMDRDIDVVTAMMASAQAVGHNLAAMALWAILLVVLMAIGFATYMVGMIFMLPLAGHATWHAYRDLIERET
ncbi:DUF2189 domain-containing protein [Uliginosibacterium sp. sgz301328]|uniref:DUF2189 domain-containing protein n=1 Tax=Uliginosibacterium sp. sgz301328 TaxID=3243764 RepID=UPI00359E1891